MPMTTHDAGRSAPLKRVSVGCGEPQARRNVAVPASNLHSDHAGFRRNPPYAESTTESRSMKRASRGKPVFDYCALGAALALLCAAGAAHAQSPGGAIGEAAEILHLRAAPPPAADFVERARPDQSDYERLAPTDKTNHKKSAAELDALASSLENARAANQRAAQSVHTPAPSGGKKPAKVKLDRQDP